MNKFYALKIKEIIRETPEAVSLSFDIPSELKETFKYKAGQYITIKTTIDGKEIRRAYSLCSAPHSEEFKVTVKAVKDGLFSGLANNKLKAGDLLEVHPPEGKFIFEPGQNGNTYAAFAAGSGITPVLSIIKTVLKEEAESNFVLVYGNKTPNDTIFFKELLELQVNNPERLFIEFVFSRAQENDSHFGRIETSTVNFVLKNKFKETNFKTFYICGPEEMIHMVSDVLKLNNIEESDILFELFTAANDGEVLESAMQGETEITILVDDEETTFKMKSEHTILDAALENDLDVPYSCQGGICSSCIARITEGKAEMRKNQILTDGEIADGLILTCQAQPTTPIVKVDYDDV